MLRSGTVFNQDLVGDNMETANKDSFDSWKKKVDNKVFTTLGLHCLDLPDEDYWLNWDKGVTHQSMADIVIKNANEMCDISMAVLRKNHFIYKPEE